MRVLRSGDPKTAHHLRKIANVGRLDSYRHRGEPHYDNVTRIVIAAAIDVAADGRRATLSDLAPSDLHDVVVALAKGSSPEHYEQAVKEALKEPEQGKGSETQVTKPKFSYEERRRVGALLSHRIRKLIPLVDALASLMKTSSSATDPVAEMIGLIETNIPEGHSYPFRDDASYFGRIGAEAIYASTTALAILDSTAAASLLKFVAKHRFFFLPFRTRLVAALAARPDTANLAVAASMTIAEAIASLDDVDSRIEAYADLAHALAPTSIHEDQKYNAKAYEDAEGMGTSASETKRPNDNLNDVPPYPIEQEAPHAFNRIAELNFENDPGKFIWLTMGNALTKASGSAALAQLARWDHRDIAGLSYSLPPFLTAAVALKHLSPDLAAALIGLDEPSGSWDWDFAKFAEAVLPGLSHPKREIAAHIILQEFDRRSGGAPHGEGLDRLQDCYARHLAGNSPSLARLSDLIDALGKHASLTGSKKPKAIDREHEDALTELLAKLDPFDASATDHALASHSASDEFRPISLSGLLRAASKTVTSVDARVTFLNTIIALDQPLEQKLFALDDIADDWIASSNALRKHFAVMARKLVSRHADELSEAGWSLDYQLRRLAKLGLSRSSIALELISSLGRSCMEVPGHSWVALASELLPFTSDKNVKRALERYLTRSAAAIPDDAAGGPWHVDLSPPAEPAQRVAGLLWSRLGAAEAAGRWRAAHAVRRLGYAQLTDCLDALVQHFHYSDAGAFGDASAPFFAMHARVWLVTAFSRLALENPQMGLRYRGMFEGILRNRTAPHAVLRHLAAKGLSAVLHLLPQRERAEAKRLLAAMAAPPHGYHQVKNYNRPNAYIGAPEGHKREFYFEYDFHKYEIDGLARVFGLPTWQVEGLCAQKVKALAPTAEHYTDTGTPWKKFIDMEEHGAISGSAPRKDLWGTYLSWHALLRTAADLYLSKAVVRNSGDADECPWREWLSSYLPMLPDGSWRADTTELFPAELVRRHWATPTHDDQKTSPLPGAAKDLAKLIALGGGHLPKDWLTISGSWHSPTGFTARVSSAFIDTQAAEHGAWAVMSAAPHDRWLPMEGDDYGRPNGRADHPFIPVLGQSYHRGQGLDRRDPYASSRAYPDEYPAIAIVNDCHLQCG